MKIVTDRVRITCGWGGDIKALGAQVQILTANGMRLAPIEDVQKAPTAGWKPVKKMKSLTRLTHGIRTQWLAESSMKTHAVELTKPDLLCTLYGDLMTRRGEHEMEVPMLEIWWYYLIWAMESTAELKLYFAWPCRFIQACGDVGSKADEGALRAIGAEFVDHSKALLPLAIAGHWTLLVIDLMEKKLRFIDTLEEIKDKIVEKLEVVLKILQGIEGLQWIPLEIRTCRTNWCRQGAHLARRLAFDLKRYPK